MEIIQCFIYNFGKGLVLVFSQRTVPINLF